MAVLAEPQTSSAVVLEAQKLLNKAALQSRAPEDGSFDKTTVSAIKAFQTESGLRATGVLDDKIMKLLRDVADKPKPSVQVTVNGKIYLFTAKEYDQLVKSVAKEFERAMVVLRGAVEEARIIWDNQNTLNKDQYIVAWCIEAWSGVDLPPESLIKSAEAAVKAADTALKGGNLAAFSKIFPKAEKQANETRLQMKKYLAKVIDGGEGMVTGLQIVSTTSFVIVGVIAVPVAAGFGLGAVAAGTVAGAGTAALESITNEVGKGIYGQSKGIGDASLNVLKDSFIGGAIGRLTANGGVGKKIFEKVAPLVAKQLGGAFFKKASDKVVVKWLITYFEKNGAAIIEGVMTDVLKEYKSNAQGLTVDKFFAIVAKQVATAGIFKSYGEVADIRAADVMKQLSSTTKKQMIKQMGEKASEESLLKVFKEVFQKSAEELGGRLYDKVLSDAKGTETPAQLQKELIGQMATDAKLIAAIKAAAEKQGKKK